MGWGVLTAVGLSTTGLLVVVGSMLSTWIQATVAAMRNRSLSAQRRSTSLTVTCIRSSARSESMSDTERLWPLTSIQRSPLAERALASASRGSRSGSHCNSSWSKGMKSLKDESSFSSLRSCLRDSPWSPTTVAASAGSSSGNHLR